MIKTQLSALVTVARELYGSNDYAAGYLESIANKMFSQLTTEDKYKFYEILTKKTYELARRVKQER